MTLFIMLLIGVTSFDTAYAQESPLQINTDIDIQQALIILGIGLAGAIVTALEGQQKSGGKFNAGKFLIAVKRTAKISVPAAFAMMIAMPDPTVQSYVMVGIVIILGAKMMHTPKPKTDASGFEAPVRGLVSSSVIVRPSKVTIPKLGPKGAKYQTNFVKGEPGNTLLFGTNLWIRRTGVRSYVTAILRDAAGNVIQIDQSHTKDEDGDIETTRLEMFATDGEPLPRGKYTVQSQGDAGSSDATGIKSDEFYII